LIRAHGVDDISLIVVGSLVLIAAGIWLCFGRLAMISRDTRKQRQILELYFNRPFVPPSSPPPDRHEEECAHQE
jgi:hypothetical protein